MKIHRSSVLSFGALALCASMCAVGSATLLPTAAFACPEEANAAEGKCDCGMDKAACDAAKANGGCGGCAEKDAKDAKACACAPGEDGKCACGAECPSHNGGKCEKEGAAAPAGEKHEGCDHDKGEGASAAPAGGASGAGLRAVVDPETGELTGPQGGGQAAAARESVQASGEAQVAREVAAPGAGTMIAFPEDRVSRSVAKVDADGNVHVGCEHGVQ